MSGGSHKQCGLYEVLIFLAAIVTGTFCSICSKTMMEMQGVGVTGEMEKFTKPLFQTFGMFVGMVFGMFMHWLVLAFKIPFPGYDFESDDSNANFDPNDETVYITGSKYGATNSEENNPLINNNTKSSSTIQHKKPANYTPTWMYFFLAIPSIFDLAATALCMMGLRYLDASIYQLLRGSGIIFVAIMKQNVLGDKLYRFQWWGVIWNVVSVFFIGSTAILNSNDSEKRDAHEALYGVSLVMFGAFVQALQFVFEEKVMHMEEAAAPPLLLIGMEGVWGTAICILVLYPIAYFCPGDDHGSYENLFNTWAMIKDTPSIQLAFVVYFFVIFGYNMFAVLVTYALSSVWHAILDNFRPITVWLVDLTIYYLITESGDFGEAWSKWSYIQLFGMFVLLYGTAVYNAPNAGSIRLLGQWYAFGIDLKDEYDLIEAEHHEAMLDAEWQMRKESFKFRKPSSMAERSPHISIHTQALRGLASPKM